MHFRTVKIQGVVCTCFEKSSSSKLTSQNRQEGDPKFTCLLKSQELETNTT